MKKVIFLGVLASMIFNACVKEEENETVEFQKLFSVDENNTEEFQFNDLDVDVATSGTDCLAGASATFDINNDSINDFSISEKALTGKEGCESSFPEYKISSSNGYEILQDTTNITDTSGVTTTYTKVIALISGDDLNYYPNDISWGSEGYTYNKDIISVLKQTQWQNFSGAQYIGFRFMKDDDYKYGWLKVENKDTGLVITKVAYQK